MLNAGEKERSSERMPRRPSSVQSGSVLAEARSRFLQISGNAAALGAARPIYQRRYHRCRGCRAAIATFTTTGCITGPGPYISTGYAGVLRAARYRYRHYRHSGALAPMRTSAQRDRS